MVHPLSSIHTDQTAHGPMLNRRVVLERATEIMKSCVWCSDLSPYACVCAHANAHVCMELFLAHALSSTLDPETKYAHTWAVADVFVEFYSSDGHSLWICKSSNNDDVKMLPTAQREFYKKRHHHESCSPIIINAFESSSIKAVSAPHH